MASEILHLFVAGIVFGIHVQSSLVFGHIPPSVKGWSDDLHCDSADYFD